MSDPSPTYGLPKTGDILAGKYRIERTIGEGGMGSVFAAHHEILGQKVAIKVLLSDVAKDESAIARFLLEAQAAARLNTEHVARVMDAGSLENGLPFLVMEYLDGCDLAELLRLNGPLPPDEAVDYILQALEPIAQAHAAGIVHRDLKPSNLFLAMRPDGTNIIKVLDFGISKSLSSSSQTDSKTLTGKALLGSPAYMSPEQVRNSRSVDERSDIWSLGIVLYELLTGKVPFDGEGVGELLAAVLEQTPKSLRSHRPNLSPALEEVVARCLERQKDHRFAHAAELAHALVTMGSGKWTRLAERIEQTLVRSERLAQAKPVSTITGPIGPLAADWKGSAPDSGHVAFARTERTTPTDVRALLQRYGKDKVFSCPKLQRWTGAIGAVVVFIALVAFSAMPKTHSTTGAGSSIATHGSPRAELSPHFPVELPLSAPVALNGQTLDHTENATVMIAKAPTWAHPPSTSSVARPTSTSAKKPGRPTLLNSRD